MRSVDDIAAEILRREGGYVDDPSDPGGATNFGVTIHTMRRLGLDLDHDGDIDKTDVRRLTKTKALDIFKQHYFMHPKLHLLPEPLQASVFDMYVNSGSNAVKILQRLLARFGRPVTVDGQLGPQTLRTLNQVWDQVGVAFVDAYGIERRNYYYKLADRRAASRKYARTRSGGKGGWIKRAEEFISNKYHFTQNDHLKRTAKWA